MGENRISRRELLGAGVAAAGASALAACGVSDEEPAAQSSDERTTTVSRPSIDKEPGDLRVFEWAGYEVKPLWRKYRRQLPDSKPNFTFLTSDDQALSKVRGGFTADVIHPCVGYVQDWLEIDAIQPWDPELISSFDELNPEMVKAGQVNGEQYFIPLDWGFDSIMYRTDKVTQNTDSLMLLYDEQYSGKISWWDNIYNLLYAGYANGIENPWDMTDDELSQMRDFLIERKDVSRAYWQSQSEMNQDFAAGNFWIVGDAWADSFVTVKDKVDATYMEPKEGRFSWVCGFVLAKDTKNYHHAHAYADAWASRETALWMLQNYYYGHANTNIDLEQADPNLVSAFKLDDPTALEEPDAHMDRFIPRRRVYNQIWDEVKAA